MDQFQRTLDYQQVRRRIIAMYGGHGWPSLFTRIRFFTAPYASLARHVPQEGFIIDLGCGYGIFSNLLALMSSKREILGMDSDNYKMKYAHHGLPHTSFRVGDVTKTDTPPADCLIMIHVLHHLDSFQAQERLIADCARKLRPGGTLLICEVQPRPRLKLLLSYLADFMLYRGDGIFYRKPEDLKAILEQNGMEVQIEDSHRGCPFSHATFIARKRL